jgi:hypothetical protein
MGRTAFKPINERNRLRRSFKERGALKFICPNRNREFGIDEIRGNHCPICGEYISLQHILMYYASQNRNSIAQDNRFEARNRVDLLEDKIAVLEKELLVIKARNLESREREEEQRKRERILLEAIQTLAIVFAMFISLAALFTNVAH